MQHNLLVLGPDQTVQWANSEAAALLGWEAHELCGKSLDVFCPAPSGNLSSPNNFAAAVLEVIGGPEHERHGSADFLTKSGTSVAVEWQVYVNRGGDSARVIVAFRPVPAELRAAQQAGNRDVFEHAVFGMFRSSIDGNFLEVNPSFARICRSSSPAEFAQAAGDIASRLYVDPGRRREFLRLMRDQGFVNDFESEIYRADGTIIWVAEHARVVRDAAGQPLYFEGSVIDITKRKAAEEALRRNEEKFRRLLEGAHILPWEADLQTGRFTYVGPQAQRLLGYPPEAWLEERFWFDHLHPEDREWVNLTRTEAVQKRQSLEFEYRMISADGRIVWLHEIMSIIPGGPRPVLGGFMLEITYRRETEESLRESKFLIEQIASASPVIVYVFDLQSRQLIYLNGRVAEILGYSKEELAMMDPFFIVALSHPFEKDEHAAHFTRLQRIGPDDIEQREFRLRSASGAWVWLSSRETAFKYDKESGALEIVGTASDITQRRAALDELQANESLFRKLAETTKVIPFEVDLLSGRFTYVGPQAEQLLGYPVSLWSQPGFWSSLVPPEYLQAAHLLTPAALELEGDFQAEFPLRTAHGRHVWIRQILNRAVGEGQRRQARGFLFDISEAKEVEQERERSRLLLRELAARSQGVREQERINLARELHDEMGQSLTLLRLDIAWVSNRLAKLASKARAVEPIQAKLHSMEQMLHETLQTVRRIISSLRPPVLDELGLADAIQWQAMEFARRVGIRCEVAAEAVDPLADEIATCVFRIFQEILTNVARHAQATRVNVKLERTSGQLCLCVADNGRGFTQSQSADGKSFGLLGMRERAWALGGTVEIEAAPGQGTTVSLELPIPIEAPAPEQATAL